MTTLEEAEEIWRQRPKPRRRALKKSIDNLKLIDGALEDLMLGYLRHTFITNYIREKDEETARIHAKATEAKAQG